MVQDHGLDRTRLEGEVIPTPPAFIVGANVVAGTQFGTIKIVISNVISVACFVSDVSHFAKAFDKLLNFTVSNMFFFVLEGHYQANVGS